MNTEANGNSGQLQTADSHVREVVRSAEQELRQLLRQRAEVMKRIGTIKQTLAGLANLFGDSVLDLEVGLLLGRGAAARRPGFTRACRFVLMNSSIPLDLRQVCERLRHGFPELLDRHKDPLASVNTILNRLVDYAEARSFLQDNRRRVWEWIAERGSPAESQPAPSGARLFSENELDEQSSTQKQ